MRHVMAILFLALTASACEGMRLAGGGDWGLFKGGRGKAAAAAAASSAATTASGRSGGAVGAVGGKGGVMEDVPKGEGDNDSLEGVEREMQQLLLKRDVSMTDEDTKAGGWGSGYDPQPCY